MAEADGSAADAARNWTGSVGGGDFEAVWNGMDPLARLVRAQEWIWLNRSHRRVARWERDELAELLSAGNTSCPLWRAFSEGSLEYYRRLLGDLLAQPIYALGRERPVGPDLELVILTNEHWEGEKAWTSIRGRSLLMHLHAGRWLVQGFWPEPPVPGWPPKQPDLTGPLII